MSLEDDKTGLIPKAGQVCACRGVSILHNCSSSRFRNPALPQLLTTMAFCRAQAEALHACQTAGPSCDRETKAFEDCATTAAPKVIETLVQIAVKHCPSEINAFQQCKARRGQSDPCKREDLAAMWCASGVVMKTAAEETAAR